MEDKSKQQALDEKDKGNEAYKLKDYSKALEHYDRAIELDPSNITFLTNKAAVFNSQDNLDDCISTCEKAVEIGRENNEDPKYIAKAFSRMGNAYSKNNKNLIRALHYYHKSLMEHNDSEVEKKIQDVVGRLKSLHPEENEGKYHEVIVHSENVKSNPDDAKLYSDRASCYIELKEFSLALEDTENCIKLNPKFIDGHVRKGIALMRRDNPTDAISAFQTALEIDTSCTEAIDHYKEALLLESGPLEDEDEDNRND